MTESYMRSSMSPLSVKPTMQYPEHFDTYLNSVTRQKLYRVDPATQEAVFENPVYMHRSSKCALRIFLKRMPSFAQFTTKQLELIENHSVSKTFKQGEIIFEQNAAGDLFYIVHQGKVEVLIQEDAELLARGDYGKVVATLNDGMCFGDRALLTRETRNATIRCIVETTCLQISRLVYEDVLANVSVLIDETAQEYASFQDDDETRSLYKYIKKITAVKNDDTSSPKLRRTLYDLSTAFTPELSSDEITTRMVFQVKKALNADRVGFFLKSEGGRSMILKVSERAKGIRLPVRGIAGQVILQNEAINVADAYQDPRFDATMDRRTGYRTKEVLAVPVCHPKSGEAIGTLQVNNRTDGKPGKYSEEQVRVLRLAAEQLAELIHGRTDMFIQGSIGVAEVGVAEIGEAASEIAKVLETHTISNPLTTRIDILELPGEITNGYSGVKVQVSLHIGLQTLGKIVTARMDMSDVRLTNQGKTALIQLGDIMNFGVSLENVPRAARVMVNVLLEQGASKKPDIVYGWAGLTAFSFKGYLRQAATLGLFRGGLKVPTRTTLSNNSSSAAGVVCVVLASDIFMDMHGPGAVKYISHTMKPNLSPVQGTAKKFDASTIENLRRILFISFNPLGIITEADKKFVWDLRYSLLDRPEMLPCFVMSVTWDDASSVLELYSILDLWERPDATSALQLLDRRFTDPKVRAYAVHCLEALDDDHLVLYMLQLCQQLKFENFVDSALSRFLIRRALSSPRTIGHIFFWMLKSELWSTDVKGRFVKLLQVYILNAGHHCIELGQQNFVMKMLESVAEEVIKGKGKSERLSILRERLSNMVLPIQFQLPLNPSYQVCGIKVEKCRVMESKKKPLWLTMKNANYGKSNAAGPQREHIVFMLKVGDDLRQDALILQLLRVMDTIWRKEGLDMQMNVYDCISTGFERGLLQVVLDATTLGGMVLGATDASASKRRSSGSAMRKMYSAMRALNNFDTIKDWLQGCVMDDMGQGADPAKQQDEMDKRVMNFMFSSAGYCVASYVLGLGDRHNDNLMMTRMGHFFHIDFGHILGNFKYKFGVKRERAPFVFTYTMKEVMTEEQFSSFTELCCDCYNILRENACLLVSLVSLAIPCELPELSEEKDVQWMYDKLLVGASDETASDHFKAQLALSIATIGTRINDAAHMVAHA